MRNCKRQDASSKYSENIATVKETTMAEQAAKTNRAPEVNWQRAGVSFDQRIRRLLLENHAARAICRFVRNTKHEQ